MCVSTHALSREETLHSVHCGCQQTHTVQRRNPTCCTLWVSAHPYWPQRKSCVLHVIGVESPIIFQDAAVLMSHIVGVSAPMLFVIPMKKKEGVQGTPTKYRQVYLLKYLCGTTEMLVWTTYSVWLEQKKLKIGCPGFSRCSTVLKSNVTKIYHFWAWAAWIGSLNLVQTIHW